MEGSSDLEYRVYTQKSETDKALNSLKGLLQGIVIDKEVNEKEIKELDAWCDKHYGLIEKNPFREFILNIRAALRSEDNLPEALEDLYWLSQKYDDENIYYNAVTCDLQTLQGVCHGILADGKINNVEVEELQKWMDNNQHLCTYYPYDELYTVLQQVLKDGIVDESEKVLLKAYFNQFVRLTDNQLTEKIKEEVLETKISGLCAIDPDIQFKDKSFCITGMLTRGTRESLIADIENFGGRHVQKPSTKTDYLIVGDNGNPAWSFSCYGRKVEKALKIRKKGGNIIIVHDYLDDVKN